MSTFTRSAAIAAAFAAALTVPAAASAAGTVSYAGTAIVVTAGSGDANAIKVTQSTGGYEVLEDKSTIPLTAPAGSSCLQLTTFRVGCPSAGVTGVIVMAGDGDDSIDVNTTKNTILNSGTGDDTLRGVGTGSDLFIGGADYDTVTYVNVTAAVNASLNGVSDDGPSYGARDSISNDVEVIVGGSGNDTLTASSSIPSQLFGGPGNDSLTSGTQFSVLNGDGGNDIITGGPAIDILRGNLGADTIDGKGGDDVVQVKDGDAGDTVTCGSGTGDYASVDASIDFVVSPSDCETVTF